jgi:hypothetical protein
LNRTIKIAPVRKSVVVRTSPDKAFEVFTARVDRWWPKTHNIGGAPIVETVIEPFVGGRWFTKCADGTEVVVGHVRVWQPAERLVVSWEINAQWKSDARVALASEVDIRFLPEDPGSTRVELEHRDFERMGAADGETMRNNVNGGWPGILALFAAETSKGAPAS